MKEEGCEALKASSQAGDAEGENAYLKYCSNSGS
jgi:hypothetical protein